MWHVDDHNTVVDAAAVLSYQLVTWSPRQGPAVALPEIMDASALCWSPEEQSWQLLSPIFGVLMLQQVDEGLRAFMPVAPLLEAAINRQIAGVPYFSLSHQTQSDTTLFTAAILT
jgi:hypothetical protein